MKEFTCGCHASIAFHFRFSNMSLERSKAPKLTLTVESEDVTEKERTPAEEAFCESFLIQSKSAVGNMYASNVYHSQKHAKEVKDLERQRYFQMSQMTTHQKEMLRKMNQLQDRQEQIMSDKRKHHLNATPRGRLRPSSTSAISDCERKGPRARARSGSLTKLPGQSLLSASLPSSLLSKSCENLSSLDGAKRPAVLPAIPTYQRSKSCNDDDEDDDRDSAFITRLPPSPPAHPKLGPKQCSPERRRGSLNVEIERNLNLDLRKPIGKTEDSSKGTRTKWIPKPQSRNLPPLWVSGHDFSSDVTFRSHSSTRRVVREKIIAKFLGIRVAFLVHRRGQCV